MARPHPFNIGDVFEGSVAPVSHPPAGLRIKIPGTDKLALLYTDDLTGTSREEKERRREHLIATRANLLVRTYCAEVLANGCRPLVEESKTRERLNRKVARRMATDALRSHNERLSALIDSLRPGSIVAGIVEGRALVRARKSGKINDLGLFIKLEGTDGLTAVLPHTGCDDNLVIGQKIEVAIVASKLEWDRQWSSRRKYGVRRARIRLAQIPTKTYSS